MKKGILITALIVIGALAVVFGASSVFAHGGGTRTGDGDWQLGEYCDGAGMMNGWGMMGGFQHMPERFLDDVAGVLGLTPEELQARLEDGATLAEIADEQGVDISQVVNALIAPHLGAIQERVQVGQLTQEQADAILEHHQQHVEQMVSGALPGRYGLHCDESFGPAGMMGGTYRGGMMGGMMGHGFSGGGMMGGGMMGGFNTGGFGRGGMMGGTW